jgi:hypothetical protein
VTDEEAMPPDVPPHDDERPAVATPDEERAWWDISGIDIPGSDYQPLPDDSGETREPVGLIATLQTVAEPMASVVGSVLATAGDALSGETGTRQRRLGRLNKTPLANLHVLHPEVRNASPRELGMRFVRIEEIAGTAVAGIDQRGGDFLPLEPFRGPNWRGRWQRISHAVDRLESLPPVDLVKFAGEYWVVDGHNRVAAVLYTNGVGVDAMVTELLPLDGSLSERPTALLPHMGDARALRAAGVRLHPVGLTDGPEASERDPGRTLGTAPSSNTPSRPSDPAGVEGERP